MHSSCQRRLWSEGLREGVGKPLIAGRWKDGGQSPMPGTWHPDVPPSRTVALEQVHSPAPFL